MKYYCFYKDFENVIAGAIIIVTDDEVKINAVQRVLYELGYDNKIVDNINEFVEWAKDKTAKIQILNLD